MGNQILVTDTLLHVTHSWYDELDRLIRTTVNYSSTVGPNYQNQWNLTTRYGYDEVGNQTHVTDTLGRVTLTEYDPLNRLSTVTVNFTTAQRADTNIRTIYAYDAVGNQTHVTDTLGRVTLTEYDVLNRPVTATVNYTGGGSYDPDYPDQNLASLTIYDDLGQVAARVQAAEERITTTYAYDPLGRLATTTNALSGTSVTHYDALGRREETIDAEGQVARYGYDAAGRLSKMQDAGGNVTSYAYDALGRRVAVTDALTHTTVYTYDAAGRLSRTQDARGNITTYAYDALGRRTVVTDADGVAIYSVYDAAGRLSETRDELDNRTQYGYDALGNREVMTNARNYATRYEYDGVGRLITVTENYTTALIFDHQTNVHTEYGYDQLGNLIAVTDALTNTTVYTYDLAGRRIAGEDGVGNVTRYAYDGHGRRVGDIYPDESGPIAVTTTHNALGWPMQIEYPAVGDAPGFSVAYDYDALGHRSVVTDATGVITYNYDALYQPLAIGAPTGKAQYLYDAVGQRTNLVYPSGETVTYTHDAANRLRTVTDWEGGVTVYTYTLAGRLSEIRLPNDIETRYGYDAAGRLVEIEHSRDGETLARYEYELDGVGNRVTVAETLVAPLTQLILQPGAEEGMDTYINQALPDNSYGDASTCRIGKRDGSSYPGGAYRSLLRFDLSQIPSRASIASASLEVYAYNYDYRSNTFQFYRAISSWDESATWSTQPSYDSSKSWASFSSSTPYRTYVKKTVDVTDLVRAWHDGDYANYGFYIKGSTEGYWTRHWFYSSDGGVESQRPRLVVEYERPDYRTMTTDGGGAAYAHDDLDRSTDIQYLDFSAEYAYTLTVLNADDVVGKRVAITDTTGATTYVYDELYLPLTITAPASGTIGYRYDADDRLVEVESWNGEVTGYGYDTAGRLLTMTLPNSVETRYEYDKAGRMVGMEHRREGRILARYEYELDGAGDRVAVAETVGASLTQLILQPGPEEGMDTYIDQASPNNSYGDASTCRIGKRDGSSYPGGAYRSLLRFDLSQIPSRASIASASLEVYAYRYEGSNTFRLYRATESWDESATWNTHPSYDSSKIWASFSASGYRTYVKKTVDVTDIVSAWHDGAHPNYGFYIKGSTESYWTRHWFYSSDGDTESWRPRLVVDYEIPATRVITYTYDPLNRLTDADYSTGESFDYAYDAVGNRKAMTSTTPLSGTLVTTYTHDAANRLTDRAVSDGRVYSYTWSARGQMLAEWTQGVPVRTFTYDGAGQMVEATVFTLTTRFTYNGLGARVAVEVVGQGATTYTLDYAAGNRILAEETDTGSTLYLYGHDCLGELRDGAWLYYLSDAEGLVRQGTDAEGWVVSGWLFDPDGAVLEGPEGPVSHLMCGGVYDWSTGLIYKDGRYFDPLLGIWLALAPLVVVQSWRGRKKKRRGFPWYVMLVWFAVGVSGVLTACKGAPRGTPPPSRCIDTPRLGTGAPGPGVGSPSPFPSPFPSPSPPQVWPPLFGPVPTPESPPSPTPEPTPTPTPTPNPTPGPGSDEYELAKMIFWEEGSWWRYEETFRVAGWVVMNRVDDQGFPNTVQDVLEQVGSTGHPAFEAYYYNRYTDVEEMVKDRWPGDPDLEAWKLAKSIAPDVARRQGTDPSDGALFFYNGDEIKGRIRAWEQADPEGFKWGQVEGTDLYYYNRNPFDPTPTPIP